MRSELKISTENVSILDPEQSNLFWEKTQNLSVFNQTNDNLIRVVVPPSRTFELIQKLKKYEINYFIDWGGNLIWLAVSKLSSKSLKEIGSIIKEAEGYFIIIKIEKLLKAQVDIFVSDPIKYKISEKIKTSFDPRRILNPGKMYTGI